jgi:hypothetical protein
VIDLATKDKAPQVYKPREGKILGQINPKYSAEQRDYVWT